MAKTHGIVDDMIRTLQILFGLGAAILFLGCSRAHSGNLEPTKVRAKLDSIPLEQPVNLTNEEWQALMSPEQFYVMRQSGTERSSGSGNSLEHQTGVYVCSACANPLYRAYLKNFEVFEPVQAQKTLASAIQIGNPVSFQKAVRTLKQFQGIVEQATEEELADAAALGIASECSTVHIRESP